jgi:two-component system sensor kinase FixL
MMEPTTDTVNERSERLRVLVLGPAATTAEVVEAAAARGDWEFRYQAADEMTFDVILLCGHEGLDPAWLGSFVAAHRECLCIAARAMTEQKSRWRQIEPHVDDLFLSPSELAERLFFIAKRLRVRDASRRQFTAIFEHAVDAIIIINREGIIRQVNRATERVFGYDQEEMKGQNVAMLMPRSYARNHDRYISNYLRTGRRKVMGIGREVEGRRKNGEVFPMELALSEFRSQGALFFAGIVRDISERRKLEHEILRTSEHERRRVGQDLHDGLGQMLTGISLIAGNLTKRLAKEGHEMTEDLAEVTELVRDADRMSRNIARGLVPVELDGEGLAAAIDGLCSNARKFFSVGCTFTEEGHPQVRDGSAASNLYRIAQECISNAVKHGRATRIEVLLAKRGSDIVLSVQDNGIGFPEELNKDRGMGVDIMGYRARVIKARLTIEHVAEGGTIITCVLSSPTDGITNHSPP